MKIARLRRCEISNPLCTLVHSSSLIVLLPDQAFRSRHLKGQGKIRRSFRREQPLARRGLVAADIPSWNLVADLLSSRSSCRTVLGKDCSSYRRLSSILTRPIHRPRSPSPLHVASSLSISLSDKAFFFGNCLVCCDFPLSPLSETLCAPPSAHCSPTTSTTLLKMRFSSTSFAVATLLSVSSTFARPSPKVPGVRWPKQAGNSQHHRREVLNITSETASSSLTAPYENIFISLTNDEAVSKVLVLDSRSEDDS